MDSLCIIIPAIKKNASIPDQLVKTLLGKSLIQRAIDTSLRIVSCADVFILTDSEEISLIATRNNIKSIYIKDLVINSDSLIDEVYFHLNEIIKNYRDVLIFRGNAPLITERHLKKAYKNFLKIYHETDILISTKRKNYNLWVENSENLFHKSLERVSHLIEIKAFILLKSTSFLKDKNQRRAHPYVLEREDALEISNYQDWWICEKLLKRKKIVFVVAGYKEIGLGHVYNSLTLAHEITNHQIIFLCTKESELGLTKISENEYKTVLQTKELHEDVLALNPDIVVNDILNTSKEYIIALKEQGMKVINFEDEGEGAFFADCVINAIYEKEDNEPLPSNFFVGHKYFCIRDEFKSAKKRDLQKDVKSVLISFGGIDKNNYTLETLKTILPICVEKNISIQIVCGPGFSHLEELSCFINESNYKNISFTNETNVISSIMEQVDIAISSAGRTIFELAYMQIPSIIFSHHEREHRHTFARECNGFVYLGIMPTVNRELLSVNFLNLLQFNTRQLLFRKMEKTSLDNKQKIINLITIQREEK